MSLARWPRPTERKPSEYGFKVLDFEGCELDDGIVDYLAQQIVVHHGNPTMIKDDCSMLLEDLRGLGYDDLADALAGRPEDLVKSKLMAYLDESIFPDVSHPLNAYIGNWGEIVCALLLVDQEGFWLPIYKLRYREKKDYSPKLTDLCAIKCGGGEPIICLGEAKTHSSRCDRNLGVQGLDSLVAGDVFDRPEILHFIREHLYGEKRYDEARFVSKLSMGRITCLRRYDLYFVHERKTWDEEILQRLDNHDFDERLTNFSVRVLPIADLRALIDRCYENGWRAVLEMMP